MYWAQQRQNVHRYIHATSTRKRGGGSKRRSANLGDRLRLVGLLSLVSCNTLCLELLSLSVLLLVIGSKQVDLIVVLSLSFGRSGRSGRANEGLASGAGARESLELGGVRLDVGVPAADGGVLRLRSRRDRLEDENVGLGGGVPGNGGQKLELEMFNFWKLREGIVSRLG